MFSIIAAVLACAAVGIDQPLVPSARFVSDGEAWPAALTPDGRSLLGMQKTGDHCDLVVWDTASKSKTYLVKDRVGLPLAASPDGLYVAGMVLSSTEDTFKESEIVIWDIAKRTTTKLLKLKKTAILPLWPAIACQQVAFSNDSTQLALADGYTKKAYIWSRTANGTWGDPKTLDLAQRADVPKPTLFEIHFKPDSKQLLVFYSIGESNEPPVGTEIWDIASGRQAECRIPPTNTFVFYTGPFPHILGENTLCYQAPEGSGKAVVGIDVSTGKEKYDVRAITLWARLSPDGKTCADLRWPIMGGRDPHPVTIGFWNFDDGTQPRTVDLPKSDQPPISAFAHDSRFLLCTAGAGGRSLFLIDVKSAKIRSSWTGAAPVRGLYPLSTGEVAVISVEPKAVVLSTIRVP